MHTITTSTATSYNSSFIGSLCQLNKAAILPRPRRMASKVSGHKRSTGRTVRHTPVPVVARSDSANCVCLCERYSCISSWVEPPEAPTTQMQCQVTTGGGTEAILFHEARIAAEHLPPITESVSLIQTICCRHGCSPVRVSATPRRYKA